MALVERTRLGRVTEEEFRRVVRVLSEAETRHRNSVHAVAITGLWLLTGADGTRY